MCDYIMCDYTAKNSDYNRKQALTILKILCSRKIYCTILPVEFPSRRVDSSDVIVRLWLGF